MSKPDMPVEQAFLGPQIERIKQSMNRQLSRLMSFSDPRRVESNDGEKVKSEKDSNSVPGKDLLVPVVEKKGWKNMVKTKTIENNLKAI